MKSGSQAPPQDMSAKRREADLCEGRIIIDANTRKQSIQGSRRFYEIAAAETKVSMTAI
jgi:hypothetical protein